MKFGFILENYGKNLTAQNLLDTAMYAEEAGYVSIWTTDHILQPFENRLTRYNNITEAITTLAYLAGKTDTIKLGISTIVLPARHPILVAKQLMTLHYLTEGRLEISYGAGWNHIEFGFLNQDFNDRGKRFNEELEIIQTLFKGETSFKGNYYTFNDASFQPNTFSEHPIPTYIAGNTVHAFKRALKYGDGWHPVNIKPETILQYQQKFANEISAKYNFEIVLRLRLEPGDSNNTQILESYTELGIKYITLDIAGGLEPLKQISASIHSFM